LKNKYDLEYIKNLLRKSGFRILKERFNHYGAFVKVYLLPLWLAYLAEKAINFLRGSKEYICIGEKYENP